MSRSNELSKRLGLRYPIIQGPFGGGLSSLELLAAVSNAGGLGSFGAHQLNADEIRQLVADATARTGGRSFAVNLWVSHSDVPQDANEELMLREQASRLAPIFAELGADVPEPAAAQQQAFESQIEALLDACPPVFSFVFGIPPTEILEACRQRGIYTIGAATTLDEALALEEACVDAVLATGLEAGGHRPSFLRRAEDSLVGTLALVRQVAAKVRVPVIAAGGIADGAGVRAALALGADAVQLGTAFLACEESGASTQQREQLFSPAARDTLLSREISGRLARFIRNRLFEELATIGHSPLPYPLQGRLTAPLKQLAAALNKPEWAPLYAGQGTPLLKHRNAKELIEALVKEALA